MIVKNHNWSIKTRDFRIQRNSGIPKTEAWIVEGGMIRFIIHIKQQSLAIIIVIVIAMPLIWQ